MLAPWTRNDRKARVIIFVFSIIIFTAIIILGRVKLAVDASFDIHVFARINAIINSVVALLLLAGLIAVKKQRFYLHKRIMLTAISLSVIFLLSYVAHHLLAGETRFGDSNLDGVVTEEEKAVVASSRMIYYIVLGSHIPLAAIVLPFILFTAYRALTGDFEKHKKLVRITWPLWFYVAITGVIVYWMISPYYSS
jgi:putative membrane protein